MIYGEELKQLDITKGLWLADDLDAVPEGYTSNQVNLINTPTGAIEVRPNFVPIDQWAGTAHTLSSATSGFHNDIPEYVIERAYQAFDVQAVVATDPVCIISFNFGVSSVWWKCFDGNWTGFATGGTGIVIDVAQYRDRYYVLEEFTSVCRYDFTAGYGFARTLLTSLPFSGRGVVTFRDRMFAYTLYNRIYYTERANTGGYPDNWNSNNNFFDLPDSGAQIKSCIVANDRLYIFTNIGVYQLYATGDPSTWQLQNVNKDVRVYNKNSVNLINGEFVFTDTKSVYVYNGGSSYLDIGQPIQGALRSRVSDFAIPLETSVQVYDGPSGYRIIPFMGDFILALEYFNSSLARLRLPKYYFYHSATSTWSEIQFDTDLSGSNRGHYLLVCGLKQKNFNIVTGEYKHRYDAFVELRYNSNTTQVIADILSIREDNQDIDVNNFQTNFGLFTQDKELSTFVMSRIKEIKLSLRTSISSVTATPYVDGSPGSSTAMSFATVGSRRERVEVSIQRGNSIALSLSGAVTKTTGPGGDQSVYTWPSFRLNGIGVGVNTDTRNLPNQEFLS